MVLSLPASLISGGDFAPFLRQSLFKLVRSVQTTPLRGGGAVSVDYAPARWTATIRTEDGLERSATDPIRAFVDRLQGGVQRVYMWDWMREYPLSYPDGFTGLTYAGGGAFDGTADVASLTASTITLDNLPVAFALKAGDMVGLSEGAYRGLYRIVADATANGSGVVTLTVEPRIELTLFSASAVANFAKPVCVMALTEEADPTRDGKYETVEFTLVQVPA